MLNFVRILIRKIATSSSAVILKIYIMQNCLLCQHNEADKTGSHIVPSFLMKRINGGGERDHEVGFEIKDGLVNVYFGRDIYEEKRKVITDNEDKLYSRENLDVRDHVFCKDCERYFSNLESPYAQSLNLNYTEDKLTRNTKVSPSEALLFWCSVVWRVSVTEHLGCRLKPGLEERLRVALETKSVDGLNVKYALFRCKDYSKISGHDTLAYMDVVGNDVVLLVDEYLLVMLFDVEDDVHVVKLLGNKFSLKRNLLNDGIKIEEISLLPPFYFSCLINSILQMLIKNMRLPHKFNEMHKYVFGTKLPEEILNDIITMIHNTAKLGDKYTVEHYAWCYKEALIKHGLIIDNGDGSYCKVSRA